MFDSQPDSNNNNNNDFFIPIEEKCNCKSQCEFNASCSSEDNCPGGFHFEYKCVPGEGKLILNFFTFKALPTIVILQSKQKK